MAKDSEKILIFGSEGQLGYELVKRIGYLESYTHLAPVQKELDISDESQVSYLIEKLQPEIVINSAAYTAVDLAEDEPEKAFEVNRDGASYIAKACKKVGARCVQVSTDYVFDGTEGRPLFENDVVNPLGVYGESKLEGEKVITDILGSDALIVRTSSLHGRKGKNFVHTMLSLFEQRDVVSVVEDQVMSPTWAGWLADSIIDLIRMNASGVYHASSGEPVSWYEFATEILNLTRSNYINPENKKVVRIPSSEFPTKAKRPAFSVLSCEKLESLLGRKPITWKQGLEQHLIELGKISEENAKQGEVLR